MKTINQPTTSKAEQDRIIAEMLESQQKILRGKERSAAMKRLPALVIADTLWEFLSVGDVDGACKYLTTGEYETPKPVTPPVEDTRAFKHSSKPLFKESRNDQLLAADVKQVGRTVVREVETRVDQSDFKRRVNLNYGGKCAITGHEVAQTLQAAHITAFASDRNNNTSNGILLDVSLHVLFDAGLMAINPETMCVHFNCQHPLALLYSGKPIASPRVALDVEALTIRWNRFK